MSIPTPAPLVKTIEEFRREVNDKLHVARHCDLKTAASHQQCEDFLVECAEALLLQRAQEIETLTKELSTEREKHDEEAYNDAMAEIDVLKAKLTAQARETAQVQAELREAYLRQGCACSCCDHGEGSDCACECHATGKCAAETARVSRAPQVEPPCDKVCQDCGSIFTIGELEREDRAVWGHPCRDSKGWSNPIDKPSSGRERRCESFRAPVQPARAPQPERNNDAAGMGRSHASAEVEEKVSDVQDAVGDRHRAVRGDGALLPNVPEDREASSDSAAARVVAPLPASAALQACGKCHEPFNRESVVQCAWCGWTQPFEKGESS